MEGMVTITKLTRMVALRPGVASTTTGTLARRVRSAPGLAVEVAKDQAVNLRNPSLIAEAVAVNHAQIGKAKTLARYADHLEHYDAYLSSAHGTSMVAAKRKHVSLFMAHLEKPGGETPDPLRKPCDWCETRGYPDGRTGPGWSASYRKSYLSALRFFYKHCLHEDELPDADPSAHLDSPKVSLKRGYTPTAEEVQRIFAAKGGPRDRLLAYWSFYAPSRRATFAHARWEDVDLDAGTWHLVGKGDKVDAFELHPVLRSEFRRYRRWQVEESERNKAIATALSDPETAFVFLSRNGKPMRPESIAKMLKWRAIRAGVGVMDAPGKWDTPGGVTSKVSPHAMRRAWATHALNHPTDPVPIDVVAEVLNHADISTTRRHYAPTKPERAGAALRRMTL